MSATSDPCLGLEELDEILSVHPSDPRRKHLESCPRCQARLLVYQEFRDDLAPAPGADSGDAATRLRAAFEQELRTTAGVVGTAERARVDRTAPLSRVSRRRRPWFRLSWAFAAGVVVIGVLIAGREIQLGGRRIEVLRERPERPSSLVSGAPDPISWREGAAGAIELRWRRAPGADSYEVRLFGPDLTDLARLGPVADTVYVLRRDEIPGTSGRTIGWQVAALRGGHPSATSRPGTFHVP